MNLFETPEQPFLTYVGNTEMLTVATDGIEWNLIGTTYTAANNLVAQMVKNGILREFTGRTRNRKFMYQDYVNLFHATEPGNGT